VEGIGMVTVTHGALSSNDLVNGVLWDGWKWQDGGTPLIVTYFFAEDGGVSWTQSAKTALTNALGTYAQVANITFSETAVRADANFVESLVTHAQQLGAVGSHDTPQGAASANNRILDATHSSSLAINQAGGYYTIDYSGWGGPADWTAGLIASGGYVTDIMIHELGHALGLKHPHDIIGSAPTFPGVPDGQYLVPGSNDLNHMFFSTMSYIQSYHFDVDGRLVLDPTRFTVNNQLDYGYASTPMAFDIAAIQYLYGVNSTYHTGNDVYLLPEADVTGAISTNWSSIWDAGGSDTNTSNLLIAVSNDSNPNDGWTFAKINSDLVVNGADSWADFPQIATDGQAIYITANMFSHAGGVFEGSRLWILNQSDFALPSGQTLPSSATVSPTVGLYDPSDEAGLTSDLFSLAPAEIVVGFRIARRKAMRWGTAKVSRKSGAFADSMAVFVEASGEARVALTGTTSHARILPRASQYAQHHGIVDPGDLRAVILDDLADIVLKQNKKDRQGQDCATHCHFFESQRPGTVLAKVAGQHHRGCDLHKL